MAGDPSFAVAFGGGGARGLAHLHIVDALDELGIRPTAIAGTSIGAIIGAGMAAGMSGREIGHHARNVLGRPAEVASRVWRSRPGGFSQMFENGLRLGQFDITRILAAFMPAALPGSFEELAIPLQVTATDFFANEEVVFSSGELIPAIAASAAIPALFRPIRRDGRLLVDGGVTNPVPFDLVRERADIVIAVDVVGTPANGRTHPGSVELLLGASQIMMQSIIALKLRQSRPDILLRPPVSHFGILDFLKIEQVLADTMPIRDEFKQAVDAAVERFRRA